VNTGERFGAKPDKFVTQGDDSDQLNLIGTSVLRDPANAAAETFEITLLQMRHNSHRHN
jgi:hypothetical protein